MEMWKNICEINKQKSYDFLKQRRKKKLWIKSKLRPLAIKKKRKRKYSALAGFSAKIQINMPVDGNYTLKSNS